MVTYSNFKYVFMHVQFALSVGDDVPDSARSGAIPLARGPSSGTQEYKTDPSLYPMNEPLPKLESYPQCTGEVKYVDDLPLDKAGGELHGAFVVSTVAACELDQVDPTGALVNQIPFTYF